MAPVSPSSSPIAPDHASNGFCCEYHTREMINTVLDCKIVQKVAIVFQRISFWCLKRVFSDRNEKGLEPFIEPNPLDAPIYRKVMSNWVEEVVADGFIGFYRFVRQYF